MAASTNCTSNKHLDRSENKQKNSLIRVTFRTIWNQTFQCRYKPFPCKIQSEIQIWRLKPHQDNGWVVMKILQRFLVWNLLAFSHQWLSNPTRIRPRTKFFRKSESPECFKYHQKGWCLSHVLFVPMYTSILFDTKWNLQLSQWEQNTCSIYYTWRRWIVSGQQQPFFLKKRNGINEQGNVNLA